MDLNRVDTERAYKELHGMITSLALDPGAPLDPGSLAQELDLAPSSVLEAIRLLAHEGLIDLSHEGVFVAPVELPELRRLSELRVLLEGFAARLAAERASEDDMAVMAALREEQTAASREGLGRLFDIDHRFHQAVARAAHNDYLARALERFYGLSLRLWYLAQPDVSVLAGAVEQHLELMDAIAAGEGDRAAKIMEQHVEQFYEKLLQTLQDSGDRTG